MIGLNVKMLRKRKGKSQEEVSSELGLTRSSYSGYENGVAEPRVETLILICDYFMISLDVLLRKDFSKLNEREWEEIDKGITKDIKMYSNLIRYVGFKNFRNQVFNFCK